MEWLREPRHRVLSLSIEGSRPGLGPGASGRAGSRKGGAPEDAISGRRKKGELVRAGTLRIASAPRQETAAPENGRATNEAAKGAPEGPLPGTVGGFASNELLAPGEGTALREGRGTGASGEGTGSGVDGDGEGGGRDRGGGGGAGPEIYVPPRLIRGTWPRDPVRGSKPTSIVLRIHVRKDGLVDAAHVESIEGTDGTRGVTRDDDEKDRAKRERAAMDAARRFRFEPARRNGSEVDSWYSVEVEFGR